MLFDLENKTPNFKIQTTTQISGLTYIPSFITEEQEQFLISQIDQKPWLLDLKRRVQHYGYKYDYKARKIDEKMKIGAVPNWLLSKEIFNHSVFEENNFDQVIINEYQQGQGISAHVDCIPCFTNVICSVSLLSPCEMVFENVNTKEKQSIILTPRSLLIMKNEARYDWTHCIPARKSNVKERRVSITFRKMILSGK